MHRIPDNHEFELVFFRQGNHLLNLANTVGGQTVSLYLGIAAAPKPAKKVGCVADNGSSSLGFAFCPWLYHLKMAISHLRDIGWSIAC